MLLGRLLRHILIMRVGRVLVLLVRLIRRVRMSPVAMINEDRRRDVSGLRSMLRLRLLLESRVNRNFWRRVSVKRES